MKRSHHQHQVCLAVTPASYNEPKRRRASTSQQHESCDASDIISEVIHRIQGHQALLKYAEDFPNSADQIARVLLDRITDRRTNPELVDPAVVLPLLTNWCVQDLPAGVGVGDPVGLDSPDLTIFNLIDNTMVINTDGKLVMFDVASGQRTHATELPEVAQYADEVLSTTCGSHVYAKIARGSRSYLVKSVVPEQRDRIEPQSVPLVDMARVVSMAAKDDLVALGTLDCCVPILNTNDNTIQSYIDLGTVIPYAMAFDGRYLVVHDNKQNLLALIELSADYRFVLWTEALMFDFDGTNIAYTFHKKNSYRLRSWNITNYKALELRIGRVTAMKLVNGDEILAASTEKDGFKLCRWSLVNLAPFWSMPVDRRYQSLIVHLGMIIAVADRSIDVFDEDTGSKIRVLVEEVPNRRLVAVQLHRSSNKLFVLVESDANRQILSYNFGRQRRTSGLPGGRGRSRSE